MTGAVAQSEREARMPTPLLDPPVAPVLDDAARSQFLGVIGASGLPAACGGECLTVGDAR
jgi:hypothetical protein